MLATTPLTIKGADMTDLTSEVYDLSLISLCSSSLQRPAVLESAVLSSKGSVLCDECQGMPGFTCRPLLS